MDDAARAELDCSALVEFVTGHLDGALDAGTAAAFERHLRGCPPCGDHLAQVRATVAATGRLGPEAVDLHRLATLVLTIRDLLADRDGDRPHRPDPLRVPAGPTPDRRRSRTREGLTSSLKTHMLFDMSEEAAETGFDDHTYLPVPAAQDDVLDLVAALRARGRDVAGPRTRLVLGDGHEVPLPEPIVDVLVQVAEAMRAGLAVTVAPQHLALSTQEAADLLGVSRMTVVRLLESGQIPFDRPGRHRRIRLTDLLEYRERQRRRAERALADMVADTERLGLYDTDPAAVRVVLDEARAPRRRD